jgi:WD40 repeat protein
LDGHTDWVNQIQWIPSIRSLVSCSNDTTIKIWKLYPFHEILDGGKQGPQTILPYSTLNDHTDYVRSLVYSSESFRLFSASDDGKICEWDLNNHKILQHYDNEISAQQRQPLLQIKNYFNNNYENQYTYSSPVESSPSCPTALACNNSGNLLFTALTDDTLRLIDTREKQSDKE